MLMKQYNCIASVLYEIDLIKTHITSDKISFMDYDNFDTDPLPTLRERIKVKMYRFILEILELTEVKVIYNIQLKNLLNRK